MEPYQDQKVFDEEKTSQEDVVQAEEIISIDPKAEARCDPSVLSWCEA